MVDLSLLELSAHASANKRMLSFTQAMTELPHISPQTLDDETLSNYLNALYAQGRERHTPNISPINTIFLQKLLVKQQPKNILEIGCANGYSTLRFWQTARQFNACITTIEVSAPNIEEARHHFAATGATTDIELHEGNALTIMPQLQAHSFDFIFIDARKIYTLDFFLHAKILATENALIVIDDVIKFKDKMQNFYEYLESSAIAYQIKHIDDDEDGVMLIDLNTK